MRGGAGRQWSQEEKKKKAEGEDFEAHVAYTASPPFLRAKMERPHDAAPGPPFTAGHRRPECPR